MVALASLISQSSAQAQVSISGKSLPLSAAIAAAQTAVDTCKANGYDVTVLPGGVAFKVGDETIAGLGVGGAPGGDKDEICAQAGVAKAADLLKK